MQENKNIEDNENYEQIGNVQQMGEEGIRCKKMEEAISKLKYAKVPGYHKITAEMIKNMGEVATEFLWEILNKVLSEEIIPKDWSKEPILSVFKKGYQKL